MYVEATAEVQSRIVNTKNGPAEFRDQICYCHNGDQYPFRFRLALRDRAPYAPGFYAVQSGSYRTGQYETLQLPSDPVLVSIQDGTYLDIMRDRLLNKSELIQALKAS